jgi:hypothetical protein
MLCSQKFTDILEEHTASIFRVEESAMQAEHSACSLLLLVCCVFDLLMTLKKEAVRSSETLVNFYQTTWCRIPEDSTLQHHSG